MHRLQSYHLSRTRDINLFPLFADTAPRPKMNFGRIRISDSGADSDYRGGFVQLTKRFSQKFHLLTNYTRSEVIDTVPDATTGGVWQRQRQGVLG